MHRVLAKWLPILAPLTAIRAAPPGFPDSGNGLWYTTQGVVWSRDYLPVGNGYLGAMTGGGTNLEILQLNIESLWTGGPFQDPTYNGGNKEPMQRDSLAEIMEEYRQILFRDGVIGGISGLGTPAGAYGSFAGAGSLVTVLNDTSPISEYARWLDIDTGVARSIWKQDDQSYTRSTFCSHGSSACTQHIESSALPGLSFSFSSAVEPGLPAPNVTCVDPATIAVRGLVGAPGMLYELVFKAFASEGGEVTCQDLGGNNATLHITGGPQEAWVSWVGDTEYDMASGDELHDFSFRGADPHAKLTSQVSLLSATYEEVLKEHVTEYRRTLLDGFSLDLGQVPDLKTPTDELIKAYTVDDGDVYVEWLLFNYGRYLLASSAKGTLPSNLQGIWADAYENAWSADYHANINIQMNYWAAEVTGMDVMKPLFDFLEKTWVPRGELTARTLYNESRGWVVHNEVNIFGHTGMKEGASAWANYPEAGAWMMFHVWDHFDYTGNITWFKEHGWPLLKGAASFQLDKLLEDLYFNDGTLVVAPCCSPEQEYITIGCAHAQQMIWQLFNAVIKGYEAAGDDDTAFLREVLDRRERMDKGVHIGSWGQLQEWKIDHDDPKDTHRHLSHLIGLYPGYALASYAGETYSREEVLEASRVSLEHRGNGTGPDADAGWEKVWRAAGWAQLADADKFYDQLKYAIKRDFGYNLFSLYNPEAESPLFQIDANLGYPAAVINAIVQTPDVADNDTPVEITLLPALPGAWGTGSIRGARARKGVSLDVEWRGGELRRVGVVVDREGGGGRRVDLVYRGRLVGSFEARKGTQRTWVL